MHTEYCGQLHLSHMGQQVTLCGWVNHHHDLGSLIFINMHDHEGIMQVFFNPDHADTLKLASELHNEFCIQVTGTIHARDKKNINHDMATSEIKVLASSLTIINHADVLPLDSNHINTKEARLKYHYLNLHHPEMAQHLKTHAKITSLVHHFMDDHSFLNIKTPMLTKATPEGTHDYLVPSHVHKGKFYTLPQSPQLFKQLLMMSSFDHYYQIIKCFHDKDLHADHQPEFTQINVETSFMTTPQVHEVMEALVHHLWLEVKGVDLGNFPVMTFAEAEHHYGSDKPDLRNPMELTDIADLLKSVEFAVFAGPANNPKGHIAALHVPGSASLTHKQINKYGNFIKIYSTKGLAYIKVNKHAKGLEGINSPVAKFLNAEIIKDILDHTATQDGNMIFFSANNKKIVANTMGALRLKVGKDLGLTNKSKWAPLWVINFPMFEDNSEGSLTAMHHPFTSPKDITAAELKAAPENTVANTYNMVINGYKVGSGSVHIHNGDMQQTVFGILGINKEEQHKKFSFLLNTLKYSTPPHTGLAFSLDHLTMLLTSTNNIHDIITFPKTTAAACLMTEAPSFANPTALAELSIQVVKKAENN